MTSPEATLLTRSNTLKRAEFAECLTDAQQEALTAIKDHREAGEVYINLHGPKNAGKTFLCWTLQDEGWEYHQAFPDRVTNPAVIYDHGDPERAATRQLRNNVELRGVACVVYVTRHPAEEVYPRVKLSPSTSHYETVVDTWERLGLDPTDAPGYSRINTGTTDNDKPQ